MKGSLELVSNVLERNEAQKVIHLEKQREGALVALLKVIYCFYLLLLLFIVIDCY